MEPGQVYIDHQFYIDQATGEVRAKFFVVLAIDPAGDVIARLLTSRGNGRPETPACFHGAPYPGFYFGVLCAALPKKSWLDLRALEDFDRRALDGRIAKSIVQLIYSIDSALLPDALLCAAAADDTTGRQEKALRDHLAAIRP